MIVAKFRVVVVVFFLSFFWTFANCDVAVSCDLKDNCILPCQFQPGPEEVIHWMTENIAVHSFYYNKDQLGSQNQRFKGRTSIFKDQISSGNASLLLKNVNSQDGGRYRCYTSTTRGNQELFIQLTVDVPVQNVNIEQSGESIICRSEGISPEPTLTWSTDPSSSIESKPSVQQNGQLYSISSSLTRSEIDAGLNYTCTVSTRKSRRTATLFKLNNVTGSESERTIQCSDSKSPVTRFIWRFDHSQIIVTESEVGGSYTASEEWRPYVKSVSETGSLTLQNLSTDKKGIYTCELINVDETLIKSTFLQITEEKSHKAMIIGVVLAAITTLAVIAAIVLLRVCKNKTAKKNKNKDDKNNEKESTAAEEESLKS
ncbi:V-set domain-containing T-cell activation inhibitor 1-like [Neolamprologus brichardi]|uniref:HERV-H LTR-associating protein 2-like n=1 Tax=Neolamprologus brichardi TaxID=32507 RepID=A0A3Q4G6T1_NEOBR|nr:V-set domain-containing T-cell activation inhibitor 1-like [Neolamprologus brichardi]